MSIAIIDYDAGNLTSVRRALAHLGHDAVISDDPTVIAQADRVVFPGVGAAGQCMGNLRSRGMDQALQTAVSAGKPVLVICVGMQLLFSHSEEDGGVDCLNIIPGQVKRFAPEDRSIKVPHMGWNPVQFADNEPLAAGIDPASAFYFVHSFHCVPDAGVKQVATSNHGHPFCAGVRHENLVAFQFHPEKSGPVGLKLLNNFLERT